MGICEFPTIKRRNSVKIEDCQNSKIAFTFPKGEYFFTKFSNFTNILKNIIVDDILFDKIHLAISYNNKIKKGDLHFHFKFEMLNENDGTYYEIGETESLTGENIIKYNKNICVYYLFEKNQCIKVSCLQNNNNIYNFSFTIGNLMGSNANRLSFPVKTSNNQEIIGEISVDGNITTKTKKICTFDVEIIIKFNDNENENYKGGSEHTFFYGISNCLDGTNLKYIYKSSEFTLSQTKNIYKNSLSITSDKLCLNDKNKNIKIEIFQSALGSTNNNPIFHETIKINQIESQKDGLSLLMQQHISNDKESNHYIFESCHLRIKYTEREMISFLEYIKGGMQINFITGIDFTNSTDPPNNPRSLHYSAINSPNSYENLILSFGNIISYYDNEQLFLSFGIGAKKDPSQEMIDCFPLTMKNDTKVKGIKNMIQVYKESITKMIQGDVLNITPIINESISIIKKEIDEGMNKYYILVLLINTSCKDIQEMKNALVRASEYPISIIIVGIGEGNFEEMENLNKDDNQIINSNGDKIKRDFIQFCLLNKYNHKDNNQVKLYGKLVNEVLSEIPRQVEEFYEMEKGMKFSLLSN